MTAIRVAIAATTFLFFSLETAAESIPALNADNIQRFLQSMDDVERLGEKYGAKEKAAKEMKNAQKKYEAMAQARMTQGPSKQYLERATAPLSSGIPGMHESGGFDEILAAVRRHGFSSVEQWAGIGDKAIRAYAATKIEEQVPEIDKQMKEMKANLAKSGLPAEQQEAMMKMMGAGSTIMKSLDDVSAADKKAIRPFISQFENLGR